MEDFNSYSEKNDNSAKNLTELVTRLAAKFDGKNQNELLRAIYSEAKKGKTQGTLTNADLDNFSKAISPFLDAKKRSFLSKITEELKNI